MVNGANEQDTVNDAAIGLLDFSIGDQQRDAFSPTVGLLTMPCVIQSAEAKWVLLTQGQAGQDLVDK